MNLTDDERAYLYLLSLQKTFEEMAQELGWTFEEVEDFGTRLFDRVFSEKKRSTQ